MQISMMRFQLQAWYRAKVKIPALAAFAKNAKGQATRRVIVI